MVASDATAIQDAVLNLQQSQKPTGEFNWMEMKTSQTGPLTNHCYTTMSMVAAFLWIGLASSESSFAISEFAREEETDRKEGQSITEASGPKGLSLVEDSIEVYALRSGMALEETPLSVDLYDENDFGGIRQELGLDEVLNRSAGLYFQNRYNFAQNLRVSVRGFGARSPFGLRGVWISQDGFPETLPDGQSQLDGIDLQSLVGAEVIKGPASVLYGNATGGVIALSTEDGADRLPAVEVDWRFGDDGYEKRSIQSGGDWGSLYGWLSASSLDYTGQRQHSATEKSLLNLRLGKRVGQNHQIDAALTVLDQPFGQDPGALTESQLEENRWQAVNQAVSLDAGQSVRQQRLGFRHQYIGQHWQSELKAFIADREFEQQLPSSFFPSKIAYDRQFSGLGGDFRRSISDQTTVALGFDFSTQEDDRQRYQVNTSGLITAQTQDELQTARQRAAFVQVHQDLGPLDAVLGLRFDRLSLQISDRFENAMPARTSQTFGQWSTVIGGSYALSEDTRFHVSRGDSFESPTFTEVKDFSGAGGFSRNLRPSKAVNFELGLRHQWPASSLVATAYKIRSRDEIVVSASDSGVNIYSNAGGTRRYGLELMMRGSLSDRVSYVASYSWSDFTYTKFSEGDRVFDGNRMPGIPKHTFLTQLGWSFGKHFTTSLEGLWIDDRFADNHNSVFVGSHVLINWGARYTAKLSARHQVEWSLGVNNLTDRDYISNIRINASRGAYFEPGPGRSLYLGLRWLFE